ncbi:LOW QUALITY PROTEIN: hypothetical protein U9M48_039393 [Paspalum notatum var. saurae]|uniref:Uncharacterized protein n=1 Tax=Paspalum notatum var. saurae TaxID=547442 RepID=A0AAQ3ULA2_PASNO
MTAGNGERVACSSLFRAVEITVGCTNFSIDCYAMPIGGFDLVLGVAFLDARGPILWDFGQQTLCFQREDRRILWAGIDRQTKSAGHSINAGDDTLLDGLLDKLQAGTEAVAVHPYRYAHVQKDELERQSNELLRQGVIRPSSSAFSSPALLIRKHDGSWHLCIDYRVLNSKTIKDKFPIPVVEELLDELRGARYFTKLDLRSRYHQVLMDPADIHRTTFRTHQGLFEFLVMPFGLTNASATFQALMNTVLQKFLHRLVLVFFDDILIYSSSWAEHLQHINLVLQTLAAYQLFLKRSKRSFADPSMAYLGHVISTQGIAMDIDKVQAKRSIKDYGAIAAPLTRLLRKEGFRALRTAITQAPVLQLPDFQLPFIVECDASGTGFGVVLHQGSGAVAFFSRPIAPYHAKLAAYEREMIGLGLKKTRSFARGKLDVRVSNGAKVAVLAVGTYHSSLPSGLVLELNNCYFIPALSKNIISSSYLEEDGGYEIIIKKKCCSIYLNNMLYAHCPLVNGLYVLNLKDEPILNINAKRLKPSGLNPAYIRHCRLGHINKKRVEKLHKDGLLDSFDYESFETCESCLLGKMTKAPFTGQGERASELLALVHTDVCGPMNSVARGGFQYFITFTDDFSSTESLGKVIKFLRSDRGGEYLSQEFNDHLKSCGIVPQLTPPGTPQWNGVFERRNRTLLDMVRSMMSQTDLPLSFWGYALETAAFTLNRVPSKSVEKTPYEIWTEKCPKLSFLKIWGCETYVERLTSDKLHLKSDKCYFVGYLRETKGYYLYNREEAKTYKEAVMGPDSKKWMEAMRSEL